MQIHCCWLAVAETLSVAALSARSLPSSPRSATAHREPVTYTVTCHTAAVSGEATSHSLRLSLETPTDPAAASLRHNPLRIRTTTAKVQKNSREDLLVPGTDALSAAYSAL